MFIHDCTHIMCNTCVIVYCVPNDEREQLRVLAAGLRHLSQPDAIGDGFSEERVCELSFKEPPGACDFIFQSSCICLLAIREICQICSLPQGLCIYHPFSSHPWTSRWLLSHLNEISVCMSPCQINRLLHPPNAASTRHAISLAWLVFLRGTDICELIIVCLPWDVS